MYSNGMPNANECLVYITNMSSDDIGHGIINDIMIIFIGFLLNIVGIYLLLGKFLNHYVLKK